MANSAGLLRISATANEAVHSGGRRDPVQGCLRIAPKEHRSVVFQPFLYEAQQPAADQGCHQFESRDCNATYWSPTLLLDISSELS
ncbi:unnamed protein product [Toxocara canis]|uniref:Uncharacterized protein n=1 Tax=Toxocara canis TaxID=6265 RepID=A0A183V1G8_TOXCA|nr:unnamed protein product [Toxocara canis]